MGSPYDAPRKGMASQRQWIGKHPSVLTMQESGNHFPDPTQESRLTNRYPAIDIRHTGSGIILCHGWAEACGW